MKKYLIIFVSHAIVLALMTFFVNDWTASWVPVLLLAIGAPLSYLALKIFDRD